MDLKVMNLNELKALQKEVAQLIEGYEARQLAKVRADLEGVAREHGFTLRQILEAETGKKVRAPVKVKYRNPENPEETWTGRGRKPRWLTAKIAQGNNSEDYAV